jgi:hypothetical protein
METKQKFFNLIIANGPIFSDNDIFKLTRTKGDSDIEYIYDVPMKESNGLYLYYSRTNGKSLFENESLKKLDSAFVLISNELDYSYIDVNVKTGFEYIPFESIVNSISKWEKYPEAKKDFYSILDKITDLFEVNKFSDSDKNFISGAYITDMNIVREYERLCWIAGAD